jgi:Rho termination factor, N-terminal domain
MDERTEAKLIFRAVRELGIDVPIMKTRVVGNRLELYLYGGRMVVYPPEPAPGQAVGTVEPGSIEMMVLPGEDPGSLEMTMGTAKVTAAIAEVNHPALRDLEGMDMVTLRDLARRKGIPNWNKLKKAEIIKALRESR